MTRGRLPNLINIEGVDIVALSDPSQDQLTRTKRADARLEHVPAFADHREMLAALRPHAVVIGSPHNAHVSQVIDAFAAGAHVLVEKPLGNTVAECRQMIEARDKTGKIGAIAYQRHGALIFREIKKIVESGAYGRLLMLNSHLAQGWLRGTRGSWRQDKAISGGGQIHDSGSHMIDILLWMTGLEAVSVTAFMDNRGSEVDINSVVNLVFSNGALGSLTIIGDAPMWQERHSFWFEHACVQITDDKLSVIEVGGKRMTMEFHGGDNASPDANFVGAIRGSAEIQAPFECGLKTMGLTEAAWRSAEQNGAVIQVDKL